MGAFVMSGDLHHYGFMTICPDVPGLRCSHRQRQPLLRLIEFAHKLRVPGVLRE